MTGLSLRAVSKSYGKVSVLKDISLEIETGELVVFIGPSGCGKSTLLRMIAGLETISAGEIWLGEQRLNDLPPSARGLAMVFQSYALYPHLSVRDNMSFALQIARRPRAEIAQAVARAAEVLQLTPYLDRLPKDLSGGQRQRVAIGRAIVREPVLFLFDEPLSNLDASLRAATRIEIAALKEALPDRTMIYVTHDQVEAMTLASRIVVLAQGRVAQIGRPMELYLRPETEFVAQFIGSPSMNLLGGEIIATGPRTKVRLRSGFDVETLIPSGADDLGLAVNLGVRPEDLQPEELRLMAAAQTPIVEGKVRFVEALGEVSLIHLDQPIIAKLSGQQTDLRHQTLRLTADPARLHLFHNGRSLLYPR